MPPVPQWNNVLVREILKMFVTATIVASGLVAFGTLTDLQPFATKEYVQTHVAQAISDSLTSVIEQQKAAAKEREELQYDSANMTARSLSFQIIQLQLQLDAVLSKDTLTPNDRQLAARLRGEIDKSEALRDYAECRLANANRAVVQPCVDQ